MCTTSGGYSDIDHTTEESRLTGNECYLKRYVERFVLTKICFNVGKSEHHRLSGLGIKSIAVIHK